MRSATYCRAELVRPPAQHGRRWPNKFGPTERSRASDAGLHSTSDGLTQITVGPNLFGRLLSMDDAGRINSALRERSRISGPRPALNKRWPTQITVGPNLFGRLLSMRRRRPNKFGPTGAFAGIKRRLALNKRWPHAHYGRAELVRPPAQHGRRWPNKFGPTGAFAGIRRRLALIKRWPTQITVGPNLFGRLLSMDDAGQINSAPRSVREHQTPACTQQAMASRTLR